ncbi:helix-turn-helix domain-containing protein [Streptosporangium roseum]|uniref:helix-turn-helix domain-containing protein n=1 Tax=Streptosporangium roseum TaxID=2001 RepID=UPI003433EDC6
MRAFAVQARLERARFLLEETTLRVGEVARALGYTDVVLFTRQFSRYAGVSPSGYRRDRRDGRLGAG